MVIWGRPVFAELKDIITRVKLEALASKTIVFRSVYEIRNDIFVTCINTEFHGGDERTPSLSVNKQTGQYHCFACGIKGDLPQLIARALGLESNYKGFRWISRRFNVHHSVNEGRPKYDLKIAPRNKGVFLDESVLSCYELDHELMFKRGLTEEIIDYLEIGYDKANKSITFPVRDLLGRLRYIIRKPIIKGFIKYRVPKGSPKKLVYCLDRIKRNWDKVDMLYMCEGPFDVASCYVAHKFAFGIQGDLIRRDQVKELLRVGRKPIVVFTDNPSIDQASSQVLVDNVNRLKEYFPILIPKYPRPVKDPNELTTKEIVSMKLMPV